MKTIYKEHPIVEVDGFYYVLSGEEIKHKDWFINKNYLNKVRFVSKRHSVPAQGDNYKVLASNKSNLVYNKYTDTYKFERVNDIPQIPQSFTKPKGVDRVMMGYEWTLEEGDSNDGDGYRLKLNNNEITIKPIE